MWCIYEIINIWTAVVDESEEWSSQYIFQFKQLEKTEKPEKKQGFNGVRTRDLRDTGAMLYQLSYEATHWERGQLIDIYLFIHYKLSNLSFAPKSEERNAKTERTKTIFSLVFQRPRYSLFHGIKYFSINEKFTTKNPNSSKLKNIRYIYIYPRQDLTHFFFHFFLS